MEILDENGNYGRITQCREVFSRSILPRFIARGLF